jgi:hypothetical protein
MAERLPHPIWVSSSADGVLDPTEVIPGPQPLDRVESDGARVISGEVVEAAARHRAHRPRRPGRGAVGTAVLSATGTVAGLSMLMGHEAADATAAKPHEPSKAVPDTSPEQTLDASLAASAVVAPIRTAAEQEPETAEITLARAAATRTPTVATSQNTSSPSTSSGRHARQGGTWDTSDWQEAIERAAAAQRTAQQQNGGRHRADGPSQGYGHGDGSYGDAPYGGGTGYGR